MRTKTISGSILRLNASVTSLSSTMDLLQGKLEIILDVSHWIISQDDTMNTFFHMKHKFYLHLEAH